MGVFDNFSAYDAKTEAAKREALIEEFLILDESHLIMTETKKPIAKIEKDFGAGSSYSANCPSCGKIKFLSGELNTMTAVCNKCHCVFKLEK